MNIIVKIQEPNPTSLNSRNKNNGVLLVGFLILGHTKVVVSHCLVLHLKRGLFYMFQMDCFKRHHLYPTIYIFEIHSFTSTSTSFARQSLVDTTFCWLGPFLRFNSIDSQTLFEAMICTPQTRRYALYWYHMSLRDNVTVAGWWVFFRSDGSLERYFFFPQGEGFWMVWGHIPMVQTFPGWCSDLSGLVKYSLCPVQPLWALLWPTWRTESPQKSNST